MNTIERALGECMVETAATVVRVWLNELGEINPYEQALHSIRTRYHEVFVKWLNIDDPEAESELDKITGEMYQLCDAVYADIVLTCFVYRGPNIKSLLFASSSRRLTLTSAFMSTFHALISIETPSRFRLSQAMSIPR